MKRAVGYGLLFSTVLMTSVVVHLPAQVALSPLPLPEGLELTGIEGTLWQGQAAQVRWQGMSLGDLNWDLHLSAYCWGSWRRISALAAVAAHN